jgi:glycerol-3-phosphate dehydrogenase subunit C
VGEATQAILAKNGVQTEVVYPGCCGMPQLEQGNIEQVVANARQVATALQPYIDDGYDIVALIPSCALMMKFEWPLLVPQTDPAYALVKKLSAATFDATEYVVDIAKRNGLAPGLKPLEADVALHIACHARAQNMGQKATEMLKLIPQMDNLAVLERCSGHGGSWGVMHENFPIALKVGKPVTKQAAALVATANSTGKKSYVASECPLAASHIMQGLDYLGADKPAHMPVQAHPLEIFAKAYGIELEGMT